MRVYKKVGAEPLIANINHHSVNEVPPLPKHPRVDIPILHTKLSKDNDSNRQGRFSPLDSTTQKFPLRGFSMKKGGGGC